MVEPDTSASASAGVGPSRPAVLEKDCDERRPERKNKHAVPIASMESWTDDGVCVRDTCPGGDSEGAIYDPRGRGLLHV
jgi:hypothetical protein